MFSKRVLNNFSSRHIGINNRTIIPMIQKCKVKSLDELVKQSIPFINNYKLDTINENTEVNNLKKLKHIMDKNIKSKNYIGLGFTSSILPDVIKRNILENPKWYTAYTPYQAEISQGRLESLYNYQKMVCELTDMNISNASLLDEASASSEVVNMMLAKNKKGKNMYICENMHPYIIDVLKTKSYASDINLKIIDLKKIDTNTLDENTIGVMFQYPNTYGVIDIPQNIINECKKKEIMTASSTNLMFLNEYITPGELGINICFGNAGNFGIPLWFGGPHAAFIACEKQLTRYLPGRIIGKSIDSIDTECYRISLQTREQHIRKEKATSNICTSQALLANVNIMYGIYHGKEGLKNICKDIIEKTSFFRDILSQIGVTIVDSDGIYFDTTVIEDTKIDSIYNNLIKSKILSRKIGDNRLGFTFDETTDRDEIIRITDCIQDSLKLNISIDYNRNPAIKNVELKRKTEYMNDDLFRYGKTETQIMRYINHLEGKDYTLCDGMMPLGSCTMKLNSASQLQPLSWDSVMNVHPYAPNEFTLGYKEMIDSLSRYLKNITGFGYISYQSNSGAMGEYSGLLCIKKFYEKSERNLCLIPDSAHGTNFSSASLTGFDILKFDDTLSIDKFEELVKTNRDKLACLMITYPGTNGVFQDNIKDITDIIHKYGGLVYMDGANMNAQVGLTSPSECGADVCHLNLHKTFCIPHGGGGPGMGPILCNGKLNEYLPCNNIQVGYNNKSIGSITSSQWSSSSILCIPYMYLSSMGSDNLKKATQIAILNANYLKCCLEDSYLVKDKNINNRVGHEFIIDTSEFVKYKINDVDIAKRLIDYNFHPGTMSWPRKNVIMIEPTESEDLEELDRFVCAMISIRKEIDDIMLGKYDYENNLLKNAPHSLSILNKTWDKPYTIKEAFYPLDSLVNNKKFPTINRVNDRYGDMKLLKEGIK